MSDLIVHHWDKWQTYRRDRLQPPWIKIHRSLMRDKKWIALSEIDRSHLVHIWLLAADENGHVPNDTKFIKKICCLDTEPNLNRLIELGFLDATKTPRRRQSKTPERRHDDALDTDKIREDTEADKNGAVAPVSVNPLSILQTVITEDRAKALSEHRKKKGSAFTENTARLAVKELSKTSDPNSAADEWMLRGWTGLKAEWLLNGKAQGPPHMSARERGAEAVRQVSENLIRKAEIKDGH